MTRARATFVVAVLLWAGLVVLGGTTSVRASLPFDDKVHHAIAWGVLGCLVSFAARTRWPRADAPTVFVFAAAVGMGFGAVDEFVQSLVPGRDADLHDLVADAVGLVPGIVVGWVLAGRPPHEPRNPQA